MIVNNTSYANPFDFMDYVYTAGTSDRSLTEMVFKKRVTTSAAEIKRQNLPLTGGEVFGMYTRIDGRGRTLSDLQLNDTTVNAHSVYLTSKLNPLLFATNAIGEGAAGGASRTAVERQMIHEGAAYVRNFNVWQDTVNLLLMDLLKAGSCVRATDTITGNNAGVASTMAWSDFNAATQVTASSWTDAASNNPNESLQVAIDSLAEAGGLGQIWMGTRAYTRWAANENTASNAIAFEREPDKRQLLKLSYSLDNNYNRLHLVGIMHANSAPIFIYDANVTLGTTVTPLLGPDEVLLISNAEFTLASHPISIDQNMLRQQYGANSFSNAIANDGLGGVIPNDGYIQYIAHDYGENDLRIPSVVLQSSLSAIASRPNATAFIDTA